MHSIVQLPPSLEPTAAQPTLPRKIAVLYDSSAGEAVYDVAVEIAARAWDAGATVRVRRLTAAEDTTDFSDDEEVPVAVREDVEWASVTLVLANPVDRRLAPTTLA